MNDDPNARLVTRDPEAMEHDLKDAEYAGTDAVDGLDSGLIEVRAGNVGGLSVVSLNPAETSNPNYTPPSQQVTPHPREGAADLPEGAPAEAELDHEGLHR
ncbi:hypothetical protein [Deinococcus sp.]|uniref:hypothetical protein n=1 Tax=Deinococcus sp. TaxID=47478 RepID=UPI003C7E5B1B